MTFRRDRYPPDWKDISRRIRFDRAGGKCEKCGVKHGEYIVREPGTDRFWYLDLEEMAGSGMLMDVNMNDVPYEDMPDGFDDWKETRVVLTVHHIGVAKPDGSPGDVHDKMDCRDENLACLCQRCHLAADRPENVKTSRHTRRRNRKARLRAAGQRDMFEAAE